MNYKAYLKTPAWRKRANACIKAAGNRCAVCNSPDYLQAHHRTYENIGNEQPGDLTCLCDRCHRLFSHVMPDEPYSWLRRIGIIIEDALDGR
jgi:predicted HNH restriction endonuclease